MASRYWKVYKKYVGILVKMYPYVFDKYYPKILKVDIHHDLIQKTGLSCDTIRCILACWTSRVEYRKVGALGGYRIDLSGNYGEAISAEHVKAFQESLK